MEWAMVHPKVVIFHEGWGMTGDLGLVAEEDGKPIGAVWCRLFTNESHGEGFIDEETPELSIAVVKTHRSKGVGLALMVAIHERARGEGIGKISLSVNHDNPAKGLYYKLGYVDYEPGDGLGRMLLDLSPIKNG